MSDLSLPEISVTRGGVKYPANKPNTAPPPIMVHRSGSTSPTPLGTTGPTYPSMTSLGAWSTVTHTTSTSTDIAEHTRREIEKLKRLGVEAETRARRDETARISLEIQVGSLTRQLALMSEAMHEAEEAISVLNKRTEGLVEALTVYVRDAHEGETESILLGVPQTGVLPD